MSRTFIGGDLVVASHNKGKVREIAELLQGLVRNVVSAGELNLPEPEETELTFTGNALLKARAAAIAANRPALADDSGLAVDALDGAPGIYSARWAGPTKDFNLAMAEVEKQLQAKGATSPEQRRAHFVCALALAWPDGEAEVFEGKVFGQLVWPGRGPNGFGYDPIFQADGMNITFGEMDPAAKHAISHRALAFKLLLEHCFGR